jgi:ankyrin repeat protein
LQKIYSHKKISILDIPNQLGITPLHYACYFGSRKVIDFLLDLGANINSTDQENNTSLHYAINSGCTKTVKKMLIRGANKNTKNQEGKTPYDVAKQMNNQEMANILKKKNFFQKFLCMESEITAFEQSRNDLHLFLFMFFLIIFKLYYICKIYYLIILAEESNHKNILSSSYGKVNNNDNIFENYVRCFDKNCIFETIITLTSLANDFLILAILIYFMCFAGNKHLKKRNRKNRSVLSLVVIYIC